jgi:hypothetical protein
MRELAKSMVRLSWAMSILFARQVSDALDDDEEDGEKPRPLRRSLDQVSEAATKDLDGRLRRLYEAGDRLQSEALDLAYDLLRPRKVARATSRAMDRAADAVRDLADEVRDIAEDGDDAKADGGAKSSAV